MHVDDVMDERSSALGTAGIRAGLTGTASPRGLGLAIRQRDGMALPFGALTPDHLPPPHDNYFRFILLHMIKRPKSCRGTCYELRLLRRRLQMLPLLLPLPHCDGYGYGYCYRYG
ncbi:uncharacterized protein MONBRDRAFT_10523 [Monosiga brevicollis MX1]|uniref:Uncharacterized protein n=1 Tax=Monosiga brevicollis TaxID=81824 RepID=A9V6L8_MONBE|nr:uncharacterized protein MONBRDRAFT_10523 [Monosiga brevicollis MX1]EDQ86755.1 predicted protein [Monosiga brevicollis MX1]|eukprot:XP_001748300.1 hypothetical protein [Monosiga brevicollis MX1]